LVRYGSFQPTEEVFQAWNRTAAFAHALGASLIVFQCPASFHPSESNLANIRCFFSRIERSQFRLIWEPRGDWSAELITDVCRTFDLIHCVDPFQHQPVEGPLHYFRLHGNTGYRYRYADSDLQKLQGWVKNKPAYVLFNNMTMREDAGRFLRMIEASR